ncbi:MAG: DUF2339 domain-containing protein [Ignavibacteriota bacterium]
MPAHSRPPDSGIALRALRVTGLSLFGITLVKALIVDMSELREFYRIVALLILGLILFGCGMEIPAQPAPGASHMKPILRVACWCGLYAGARTAAGSGIAFAPSGLPA